jgi:hypothetical protein
MSMMWGLVASVLVGLTVLAPIAATAQPAGKVWRIGIPSFGSASIPSKQGAFTETLRDLGYVEGRNLAIEWRCCAGGDIDRLNELTRELTRLPVDVLVVVGPQAARAAKAATRTILSCSRSLQRCGPRSARCRSCGTWTRSVLPMHLSAAHWGMIAIQAGYMGLLVGVASMYLYTRAIALLGSVRASVFVALVPLVTSFASAPLIAEQPNVSEVAGMIVVVLGVALSLRS